MVAAIEKAGVATRLAQRVAHQLVFKFEVAELGGPATWNAIGRVLRRETEKLSSRLSLVDRQIIVTLPKLAPDDVEHFLEELRASDPRIARTILNSALDAADPRSAGRRYLGEYHRVIGQLNEIDRSIARTVANATFMARVPPKKAMDHLRQFADLLTRFHDDVDFVRTVARASFRAADPLKAARRFIADHDAVVADLTSTGVEPQIARTIASIASVGADPMPTAHRLVQKFREVVGLAKKTHPAVARSIALTACRATDPLGTAQLYMQNYDSIVRVISRTDPRRAHTVAAQAFRSDHPLRWAKRYLSELKGADPTGLRT